MDENELRAALRDTITLHPEPPPMESKTAIAAARRAATRRNLLAGIGSAAAILGITLAVIPGQAQPGGGTNMQVAGEPSAAAGVPFPTETPSWADTTPSGGEKTEPSWPPENSGDATADTGPHYQNGKKLLTAVVAAVPDGYTAKTGNTTDGIPFRSHQSTIENDGSYWRNMAAVAIGRDDRVGELLVEVAEPGNNLPKDPCALAEEFWGRGGNCTPVNSKVGVIHEGSGTAWAAYRHSDGTVVYVMQSTSPTYADPASNGLKPLPALPLSDTELAALATDASFR
ncbi:hypothetical protein Q0Z83_003670 [Actinoplanes sichuanensis]|uniref:Uncharacterized protein n=1 Tax=Actinoplanes sichuanensis TaxID=512349 RepID=A0ABW4AI29_9ACTN|nr:hypothetical protein [Actinoplanes sichuanensis]BEL02176.1 hypothetical protein Q0Z83_003670 [Actinoplanes sichuanensis]